MNHVIVASQPLVTLVLRHYIVKVTYSVSNRNVEKENDS